jgi:hypothetical protein
MEKLLVWFVIHTYGKGERTYGTDCCHTYIWKAPSILMLDFIFLFMESYIGGFIWKATAAVVHQAPSIHTESYSGGFLFAQKSVVAAHRFGIKPTLAEALESKLQQRP